MNSRQKGKRGELEWAEYLRAGGIDARRGCQFSGSPDSPDVVTGLDDRFHFEVKRVEALNVNEAMAQAEADCGEGGRMPVVAHRRNRTPWLVTMRACDWLALVSRDRPSEPSTLGDPNRCSQN